MTSAAILPDAPAAVLTTHSAPSKKTGTALSAEAALANAQQAHAGKNFDWTKFVYVNARTKVTVGCKVHGDFHIVYDSLKSGRGCRKCGYETKRESQRYTSEVFIAKVREKVLDMNGDQFDYSKVEYTTRDSRVLVTCKVHGEFAMHPGNAMHLSSGCPVCAQHVAHPHLRKPVEQLCKELLEALGSDKYSVANLAEYTGNKSYITLNCKDHGDWVTKPNWILSGRGCPGCSGQGVSKAELSLLKFVESSYSGEVVHGDRAQLRGLELDIYLPELQLAVEYNGLYYHSEKMKSDKDYHLSKTVACRRKGIRLIHVYEDEWLHQTDLVKSRLLHILGVSKAPRLHARKLIVDRVSFKEAKGFFEENHLQGSMPNQKHCYGLFNDGELVSAMSFGDLRFEDHKEGSVELFRFACSTRIPGAFTKLLKAFMRDHPEVTSIKSYSDKRWSAGDVYVKNGFKFVRESNPSYDYTDASGRRFKRQMFMKKEMPALLKAGVMKTYDPLLTETENCANNGFWKVWNCGMDLWEYQVKQPQVLPT